MVSPSDPSISIAPKEPVQPELQFSPEDIKWSLDKKASGKLIGEVDVEFEGKTYTIKVENIDEVSRGGEILMEQAKRVVLLAIAADGPIKVTGQNFEYMETGKAKIEGKKVVDVSWTGTKSYIGEASKGDITQAKQVLEHGKTAMNKLQELSQVKDGDDTVFETEVMKSDLRKKVLGTEDNKPKVWGELDEKEKTALGQFVYGKDNYKSVVHEKALKEALESLHQRLATFDGNMEDVKDELEGAEARYSKQMSAIESVITTNPKVLKAEVKVHKTFWENVKGTITPAPKAGDEQKPRFADSATPESVKKIDELYEQASKVSEDKTKAANAARAARAALQLGEKLRKGEDGVFKNYAKAEHFLQIAIENGDEETKFEAKYQFIKVRQAKIDGLSPGLAQRKLTGEVETYFKDVEKTKLSNLARKMFDSGYKEKAFEIALDLEKNKGVYELTISDYEILTAASGKLHEKF